MKNGMNEPPVTRLASAIIPIALTALTLALPGNGWFVI
jgi:hypothetical protein